MIHHKQILTGFLSILGLLATPAHAEWNWQDVAVAGLVGAGVGACVYAATRPEDPHTVKRNAEALYSTISRANRQILESYRAGRAPSEKLIHLVIHKGRSYHPDYWPTSNNSFLSNDCKQYAPLLRGYAALLDESEQLLAYRRQLIDCFGSTRAARYEYYNFDNLEALAHNLQIIARTIEHHTTFIVTRDNFAIHCANREEHARTRRQLVQAQADLAAMRSRRDTYHYEPGYSSHCGFNVNFYN